ncbi:hormogonium polysaccharide biosynthesis protein HpsJ [Mastigocladopsis repens]|uniref:hormogonium polysaccharide biosynthesis protein HpsJ n=1 Tax=Mastigocladopsis repens TaxID=221287 RepID=UPI0002F49809|nr:HpsJ family protein [Mastigocladopsis repens]
MNNRFAAATAARTLKVVGVILILSFLIDFVILSLDFSPTDKQLQLRWAASIVDRGVVPLVGLGMLFAGYWIDSIEDGNQPQPLDFRMPALIISSILGLLFLVIAPVHAMNVIHQRTQVVDQITQDADRAENQLKTQLNQVQAQLGNDQVKAAIEKQRTQVKAQYSELLQNEQRYNQALNNPNVPQATKDLLKKFKANPQELDKFIAQQTDPQQLANQRLAQIRSRREELEKQAQENWKPGLRIVVNSLLLSVAYIIIGWAGLRSMGAFQGAKRKVPAR